MLKRKKGDEPRPPGAFNALVKEALQVEKEIRKLDPASFKWSKMDGGEFTEAALKNCGKSREEVEELYDVIRSRQDVPSLGHFIATAKENFQLPVGGCAEPPRENFNSFTPPNEGNRMVSILIELQLLPGHFTPLDLIATASMAAVRESPKNFGFPESEKVRLRQLGNRRDELAKEISEAWTPEDLDFVEIPGQGGLCKVTFRVSGGAVPVNPRHDCGARLVKHLADRPELARAYL